MLVYGEKTICARLDTRAHEAIMAGYARKSREYKLCDRVSRNNVVSRGAYFDKTAQTFRIHKWESWNVLINEDTVEISNSETVADSSAYFAENMVKFFTEPMKEPFVSNAITSNGGQHWDLDAVAEFE